MNKRVLHTLFVFSVALFLSITPVFASQTNGTILNGSNFAWGENLGWINFAQNANSTYNGLTITDTAVTGYGWSSTAGWINFNPTNSGQGVSNTPDGHLSGSAWVSGLGWLSMNGVTINANGKFTGVAGSAGNNVGRVSFDCDRCSVVTDWRPVAHRTAESNQQNNQQNNSSSGSLRKDVSTNTVFGPPDNGGVSNPVIVSNPNFTDTSIDNKPQQNSETIGVNGGTVTQTTHDGRKATVHIPQGTFNDDITVTISLENLTPQNAPSPNVSALLVGGNLFNIIARDKKGNIVHALNKFITITIDLPKDLKDTADVNVYYLDESNTNTLKWIRVPNVVVKDGKVSVEVNHLTVFGIFRAGQDLSVLPTGLGGLDKAVVHISLWWLLLVIVILILIFFYTKRFYKNRIRLTY